MFEWLMRKPAILRRKRVRVAVPNSVVLSYRPVRRNNLPDNTVPRTLCLMPDVKRWCAANNIKIGRIFPEAIFGEIPIGPFSVEFFSERDAIFFKTRWSGHT